ncbi:MAG: hypothetical protein H3C48_02685 [Chitinophagaceae bacterium]|nr:hypothetical protein [Chitinophagaceae bacterium]
MKTKSKMELRTGKNHKGMNRISTDLIGRFISRLLVLTVGLFMMSFIQEESIVIGNDTNKNVVKISSVDGKGYMATLVDPGKGSNSNSYAISTPGNKAKYEADREAIVGFIVDARDRRIWSLNRQIAAEKADYEMRLNFLTRNMYPAFESGGQTDLEMQTRFIFTNVSIATPDAYSIYKADKEMSEDFIGHNLQVTINKPLKDLFNKADADMTSSFEKAMQPVISLPTDKMVTNADREVWQHFNLQIQ